MIQIFNIIVHILGNYNEISDEDNNLNMLNLKLQLQNIENEPPILPNRIPRSMTPFQLITNMLWNHKEDFKRLLENDSDKVYFEISLSPQTMPVNNMADLNTLIDNFWDEKLPRLTTISPMFRKFIKYLLDNLVNNNPLLLYPCILKLRNNYLNDIDRTNRFMRSLFEELRVNNDINQFINKLQENMYDHTDDDEWWQKLSQTILYVSTYETINRLIDTHF